MVNPRPRRAAAPPRIGLALAGGGPMGAIHEIGALCALEDSVDGLDFTALGAYVGVSAGAVVAAALANGLSPRAICAAFIENVGGADDVIEPGLFTQPAWHEFARSLAEWPRLAAGAGWQMLRGRASMRRLLTDAGRLLPNGLFDNRPLQRHLERLFSMPGRSNDFRALSRRLVVVACDLDTGEAAPFGLPGWDDTPISLAVAASAALPGLYPPVTIGGRSYVDGALKKTMHGSVLLDQGLDLLICLNPLVPFDASQASTAQRRNAGADAIPPLAQAGLPVVLSQTFRSLIHSRLELGMKSYEHSHPGCDILLFEPDHGDAEMFHAGTFSYAARRRMAQHAFQQTRRLLRERQHEIAATFARHGLTLDVERLHQPRQLFATAAAQPEATPASELLQRAHATLDGLERWLALQPAATAPARRQAAPR